MDSDRSFGLKIASMTRDHLESVKKEWLSEDVCDEDDLSRFDYEQLFQIIESSQAYGPLNSKFNASVFFSLVAGGKCHALVELVQSKKGRDVWVKVMDIYISPEIEFCQDIFSGIQKRSDVFAAVVVGVFEMFGEGVGTVKVYGRSDNLLNFLRIVHSSLSAKDIERKTGISTSIAGRWLVFQGVTK